MSNKQDDAVSTLIGLGIITAIGYGVYKIVKSTKSYKEGQRIEVNQIDKIASDVLTQSSSSSYQDSVYDSSKKYAHCTICQKDTEQCQYSWHRGDNRCIECNGGKGYTNECNECYHDQSSDDD